MLVRRATAAVAVGLLIAAVAGPAAGTEQVAAAPAIGSAGSGVTLLELTVGGHTVRVGDLALASDTTGSSPTATVTVTPIDVDGTAYGQQTVTPGSGPLEAPSLDSRSVAPGPISALASAKSPVIRASSSTADGASSRADTVSLGSLSLLGLPVALDGDASVSAVVDGSGAVGEKTLTIRNVALPSIADLLAALGLDLTKLPAATLTTLVERLGLVTSTVTTAKELLESALAPLKAQLDAALAQVTKTTTDLVAAQADLDAKTAQLAAAGTALEKATQDLGLPVAALRRTASLGVQLPAVPLPTLTPLPVPTVSSVPSVLTSALPTPLPTIPAVPTVPTVPTLPTLPLPLPTTAGDVPLPLPTVSVPPLPVIVPSVLPLPALPPALDPATQLLNQAYGTAYAAYTSAIAAVNTASTAVNDLNALLSTATNTVNGLLAQVQAKVDALTAAVVGVLDATPLVSLDSVTIRTRSAARSAAADGQDSEVVGGEINGLHVLGSDVLANALGSSKVDLSDVSGSSLAALTGALGAATGTLSSVLSNVPGLPTLSVPAPAVGLLTKSTSTSSSNGYGHAANLVHVLSLTIPAMTLPAAVALPNASSLPAYATLPGLVRSQAVGDLVSTPVTVRLGTLSDTVAFKPAVVGQQTGAPGTTTPGTITPGASTPGTTTPDTAVPGTANPGTTTPGAGTPGTGNPGSTTPRSGGPATVPTSSATPQLPRTGLPGTIPLTALLLVGGAFALRRRLT